MKDKIVVITGAGSGIGRALAEEFGALGAKLALNDYSEDSLKETAKLLSVAGVKTVFTAAFDVSKADAMQEFAKNVKSNLGNANIIINNAGIAGADLPGYLIPESAYRKVMDVNFFGVLNGCQAFLPQMVEENKGNVVNISSIFGLVGTTNNSDYCAAKFAVRGYTECLATEFHESPINIHCVHPGGINTNIAASLESGEEYTKKYLTTNPNDIAKHIIKSIQKNKVKIVYGADSKRAWLVSNFLPQKITNALIWKEAKGIIDLNKYKSFIKNI